MTEQQFRDITEWQNETFKNATSTSKINHLKEEVDELWLSIKFGSPVTEIRHEFADCFLLLFGAAASEGMTYANIVDAINEKMEINKKRKWGNPNAQGYVKHIDEPSKTENNE